MSNGNKSFDWEQAFIAPKEEDDSVLLVCNLDNKVTEAMLYELFLQVGPIEDLKIQKGLGGNNGFCYIYFVHDQSVPYAINVMDGTTLFGSKLNLLPQPKSTHKKVMEEKKAENRQKVIQQQQQGFAAAAPSLQLAQVPRKSMSAYQTQMYTQPKLNLNMKAMPSQSQVGHPLKRMRILPQTFAIIPQGPPVQQRQPTMMRGSYHAGAPVPFSVLQQGLPPSMKGLVRFMQPVPGTGATPTQLQRSANATTLQNAIGMFRRFPQATSVPPLLYQQRLGPRPPIHAYHIGNVFNGNVMPYNNHQQQRFPPPQQQQQQQQIPHPGYFTRHFKQ